VKAITEALKDIKADDRKVLENAEVSAYASPDGAMDLNERLAQARQKAASNYMQQQLKKTKTETNVDTEYTAEDWEGFKELVEASNIVDKDLILRVLSMYKEPEAREREIKNISSVYSDLANEILPQLRRARLSLHYQLIGRSDDEIQDAVKAEPEVLTVEEILYAATLTDDNAEKESIFNKAIKYFPSDYRAYNNIAEIAYAAGDYDKAKTYLERALKANPNAAEVNTNLGMLELLKGNKAEAEVLLAKGTNAVANSAALGNLYIAQGQYARAAAAFGETKSNAAALAQIMAKDYSKAQNTLSNIANPDAYTYYLTAILGARTNKAAQVAENLAKAVKLDKSLIEKAKNDIEFAKYVEALAAL
jgi:Flp pilus assembly protein TadD